MMIKIRCKKCNKTGYFDLGDMTKDEAMMVLPLRKSSTCFFGGHKENIPPTELFDFFWDDNEEDPSVTEVNDEPLLSDKDNDENFVASLKSMFSNVYSEEEIHLKYNIESFAFGAYLCSSKEDEDSMIIFQKSTSPSGAVYYYSDNGGW